MQAEEREFVLPRPQSDSENCVWHIYNVVPTDKRYVVVAGNFQAGVSVVDFTDPANPSEIAYADPAPLGGPPQPGDEPAEEGPEIEPGGDWATYWHSGFIYESDITRGLILWRLSHPAVAGAVHLDHSNPQTQEICLRPRQAVSARGIGRIGLGLDATAFARRAGSPPVERSTRRLRWCVQGDRGDVTAVLDPRGRSALIATTARAHVARGVRRGDPVRRVRNARELLPGVLRSGRQGNLLIGVRRGRVQFLAVARRSLLRNRAALRRALRTFGAA